VKAVCTFSCKGLLHKVTWQLANKNTSHYGNGYDFRITIAIDAE
jgi:hypothetical protein